MYNLEIRLKIKQNRLCHYEVARALGITEYTFCKWLREEMNEERKNLVLSAIDKLISVLHSHTDRHASPAVPVF